jgi:hypothetical protein
MPPSINLTGQRFDRLLVLERAPNIQAFTAWRCACDCGNVIEVRTNALRCKRPQRSCGCSTDLRTHGMTNTPEYRSWQSAIMRCENPNALKYPRYGGRGIKVCAAWRDSFETFYADMGPRPAGTTLDRWPNKDGDYEPGNCRWATASQQNLNRTFTPRKHAHARP